MKKRARLLATLLAAAMCITACGNVQESEKQSAAPSSKEEKPVDSTADEETTKNYWEMLDEVSDSSELPDWTGEKLEITVWYSGGSDASFGSISDTNVTFKEIERVTGIVINAEDSFSNGGDSIDAKLPRLLASKEFPTLVYGWHSESYMMDLYENGYLADLTEYYENGYLDHLQHWFPVDKMEDVLYNKLRAEDGSLVLIPKIDAVVTHKSAGYSVPEIDMDYYNVYGKAPQHEAGVPYSTCLYIRDDVLQAVRPGTLSADEIKKLYMENGTFTEEQIFDVGLKSTEDFVELLYDIKEELATGKYTGLNGEPMEVTYGPNSEADNWSWMVQLNPLISGYQGDYFTILTKENIANGKMWDWGFKNEVVLEHMKLVNNLLRDDIISQNSLVDNSATFSEKVGNGHYALTYGTYSGKIGQDEDYEEYSADWGYRPIWIDMPYNKTDVHGGVGTCAYYGIFKDAVPEGQMDQLIHYIDFINSMVGINLLFYGPASAGLFTVDADGNRVYTDSELEACMLHNENNGANVKYGLVNQGVGTQTFGQGFLLSCNEAIFAPSYVYKSTFERTEKDAFTYFNPGVIPGKSFNDVVVPIKISQAMYGTGLQVESIAEFWKARAGFEDQMKKTIAAETDAEFEAQLQALWDYADEFGLTDEALKEYNELVIGLNYDEYTAAGYNLENYNID